MIRQPEELIRGVGNVSDSKFYKGVSTAIKTDVGEVIIVAESIVQLEELTRRLTINQIRFNKNAVEEVCVFSTKKLKES